FFSSRRRHTRFSRDWSSDVCSSDLVFEDDDALSVFRHLRRRLRGRHNHELRRWVELHAARTELALLDVHADGAARFIEIVKPERSEERRVGNEVEGADVRARAEEKE